MKTEILDCMISDLDQKHNDLITNQETPTGTNLEVRNTVAQRMVNQRNYEIERKKLVKMRDETIPLSKGVLDFLTPKKIESKFDVENGTSKIDTSLETPGKSL